MSGRLYYLTVNPETKFLILELLNDGVNLAQPVNT